MLLQQIIRQFDEELVRLHAIREIVAGLASSPAYLNRIAADMSIPLEIETAIAEPKPRSHSRKLRSPAVRVPLPKKVAEPTALSRPLHGGPVVIPFAQLHAERERRTALAAVDAAQPAMSAEVDLDALSRHLTAQWLTPSLR